MDRQSMVSSDTQFAMSLDAKEFPIQCKLSLAPLVTFWGRAMSSDRPVKRELGQMVQEQVRQAPEVLEPIEDLSVIAKHRELVDVLMAMAFPMAFWEQDYAAALIPFHLRSFYATPAFERLLMAEDGMLRGRVNVDEQTVTSVRLLHAYAFILRRFYGIELGLEYPLICTATDPDTGLDRHFKMNFDGRFLDVDTVGEVTPLTGEAKERLLANLADPQALMELIPPEQFVFRGFTVLKAIEVTDQEVLSSLKRELIDKESIVSTTHFQGLQQKLRTLFRRPDLCLGLAAIQRKQVLMLNSGRQIEHSCIFADSAHYDLAHFVGSIYERAVRQGEPLIIEDLTTYPERSALEEAMIRNGMRNIAVAPLYYQDELIGMLGLESPHPGDLNAMNAMKLREVLPLFSMAVKRSMEELNGRIQAVIKEQCTAIHPSVEWRFRKAVLNSIEKRKSGLLEKLEPIVFDGVYPLYGVTDIRGSSTHRNAAIQADLIHQLRLAREVVEGAHRARRLPILDELGYRIDKQMREIELSLRSGDEESVLAFVRGHIEARFAHMEEFGPKVREKIQAYRAALDPRLGTIYQQRKEFEESVTLINDAISSYLDGEEEKAQGMFPHYFERQKTDGVEYGMYIGASLVENGGFDVLYLKNLRLWQLMLMCGIARQTERLKGRLKVPLETTHLILVQHSPLAIRFRFDEKRFDVDGAYNMRYEIAKKRIDKATVSGTHERVTQPAKIAIVYSQSQEAAEYREYIDYLQAAGYLAAEVEDVELEGLQGVEGLRALRVTVDMQEPRLEKGATLDEVEEAVKAISRARR